MKNKTFICWGYLKNQIVDIIKSIVMLTQGNLVYLALNATETTETQLGTITVPTAGVRRIVGVYGYIMQPTSTAAETVTGYYRLAFTTISGTFKFPASTYGGPAGTLAANAIIGAPQIIPVDIPVPPNETITCYMGANKAMTGTGEGMVGVIFE